MCEIQFGAVQAGEIKLCQKSFNLKENIVC